MNALGTVDWRSRADVDSEGKSLINGAAITLQDERADLHSGHSWVRSHDECHRCHVLLNDSSAHNWRERRHQSANGCRRVGQSLIGCTSVKIAQQARQVCAACQASNDALFGTNSRNENYRKFTKVFLSLTDNPRARLLQFPDRLVSS